MPISGVADCPCCGETVSVSDATKPEPCDDCTDEGCKRPSGELVGGWHAE